MGLMAIYFQTLFNLHPSHITGVLHLYNFFKYFSVLIGAILADSYYGRVKLIIMGQIIFFLGNTLLTISSTLRMDFPSRFVLCLALFAKMIGSGFVLPCLIPLAADQMRQQNRTYTEMKAFFVFYFAMLQLSDFLAKLFLPLMLEVSCFNLESCYPLAFGIPSIFSLISLVVFYMIKERCFNIRPHQPIIIQGLQCCCHALRMKIKNRKTVQKDHWLYHASDRYDMKFIEEIKSTINVLFVPIPFYWSLFDQQATSWTLQAARLDTQISNAFRIMPEQTQAFGPFFFLLLIPLFHFFIYDLLYPLKFLRTLLRRMVTGGYVIAASFFMAFFLEARIEFSYPDLPASDLAYVYVFNGIHSAVNIEIENRKFHVQPYGFSQLTLQLSEEDDSKFQAAIVTNETQISAELIATRQTGESYVIVGPEPIEFLRIGDDEYSVLKHPKGRVKLRIICVEKVYCKDMNLRFYPKTWYIQRPITAKINDVQQPFDMKMHAGIYEVYSDSDQTELTEVVDMRTGGVYNMMVYRHGNKTAIKQFEITPPNEISVLWMIPQYIILSISMVLFRISAFAFLYTETPDTMKSLAWSMCYMNLSTGNVITVIFGGTGKPVRKQLSYHWSISFLIFGLGMVFCMLFFIQAAYTYKYTHKYPDKRTARKSLLNVF
ncbi:peptide transporter 3 isoform X3 [Halyomorpha halys]